MLKSFRLSSVVLPEDEFGEEPTLPGHGDWSGRRGGRVISRRLALLFSAIEGAPVVDLEPQRKPGARAA